MKPCVLAEPILIGRERELEELQHCLDLALQGNGNTVFISGEAGSGKTRLTNDFLSTAKKQRVTALTGWCLSNAAVPYFPFFEAFNAYFSGEHKQKRGSQKESEITEWLKGPTHEERRDGDSRFSAQVWKDQTFAAVTKTLLSISVETPIVLFIDDIHWADSASLSLIHYIARTISSEKILLLATFRREHLAPDPDGRPHPLVETLRLMRREDLFKEIKLGNLGQASVSELAKCMLGGDVQRELAEKLAQESKGNPLFVVESLRMLYERDGLIQEHENWRLTSDKMGIPEKIKDIILQRLSLLLHNQRRMLEAASVMGEKFRVELLASVFGQDYLSVADALDMIGQTTSLICSEGDVYWFDHAGSRNAIYDGISPAMKKGYHAKIAQTLESAGRKDQLPLADLAYHYAQAQNEEKAVEFALAAGQHELARWSNTEAVHHFQYVLQKIGSSQNRFNQRMTALEGLGDAYYAGDNFRQAEKVFDQLADLQSDSAKLRALRKAMFAAFFLGDISLLTRLTRKAEENATADRLESARVLHQKARVYAMQGDLSTSLKLSEEALKVFEEEYALSDAAWILFTIGANAGRVNENYERGVAAALRSIALYDGIGDILSQLEAYIYAGFTFHSCGLQEEAKWMFTKVIRANEEFRVSAYIRLIPAYAYLSRILLREGNVSDSISMALKALEYVEKTDSNLYVSLVYEILIMAYARAEDTVLTEEYFGKFFNQSKDALPNIFSKNIINLTMGMYYGAKNEFEKADNYFSKFFEHRALPVTIEGRQAYAWVLSRQGRMDEAKFQLEFAEKILKSAQERFAHVILDASLMTFSHPEVDQIFKLRLDLVNVSRSKCRVTNVKGLITPELVVVEVSPDCLVHDGTLEFKDETINAFSVKVVKLSVKATEHAVLQLNPTVEYVDDLGETKTCNTRTLTITVQPAKPKFEVLPGRVLTGLSSLDALLFGGIPEKSAVVLASPSTDERELVIKRFLETGAKAGQKTFNITSETAAISLLTEKYSSNFILLLCNPQADSMIQNLPNVFKLKGVENLTDIDIALTKAFRTLDSPVTTPQRICINIISDILLQHHAVNTRRWLSSLLPTLKSKGFTVLAVIDPAMHPAEETQAVLGLFDGEIAIFEKETSTGMSSFLKIKKMAGQKYQRDETPLTDE